MCKGTNVVPCGRSDMPGIDTVKLFCPNCNDIYTPPSSRFQGIDGMLVYTMPLARATDFPRVKAPSLAQPLHTYSSRVTASSHQLRSTGRILPQAHLAPLTHLLVPLANPPPLSTRILTEAKSVLQAKSMFPRSMASRLASEPRVGRGCNGCV